MDTLTHALSGALLARATEPKTPRPDQLPRRTRMWIGFWAAAFPDSDFIVRFIDPLTYLTTHRGITHSVVMLPLWALVLAFAFMWILRKKYSWRAFVGVIALGIGAHIVGDVITAFGTMIFAPLSDWRAQLPATFIIDPYFTGILIAGLIAAAVWKDTRRPAVIGLAVLAGYVGFQGLLHQRAVAVGEAYAASRGLKEAEVSAVPQPFSPFNWMLVVEEGKHLPPELRESRAPGTARSAAGRCVLAQARERLLFPGGQARVVSGAALRRNADGSGVGGESVALGNLRAFPALRAISGGLSRGHWTRGKPAYGSTTCVSRSSDATCHFATAPAKAPPTRRGRCFACRTTTTAVRFSMPSASRADLTYLINDIEQRRKKKFF